MRSWWRWTCCATLSWGPNVSMDALLTQHQIAPHSVAAQGDYVMVVKENQPQLLADMEMVR